MDKHTWNYLRFTLVDDLRRSLPIQDINNSSHCDAKILNEDSIFSKRRVADRLANYLSENYWSVIDAAKLIACGETDCDFDSCSVYYSGVCLYKDDNKAKNVLKIYDMLHEANGGRTPMIPQDCVQFALSKDMDMPQQMIDWYDDKLNSGRTKQHEQSTTDAVEIKKPTAKFEVTKRAVSYRDRTLNGSKTREKNKVALEWIKYLRSIKMSEKNIAITLFEAGAENPVIGYLLAPEGEDLSIIDNDTARKRGQRAREGKRELDTIS